jgi:hypothetical protein
VQRPSAVIFNGFHRLREAAATTVELPRHPCTYIRIDQCTPKSNIRKIRAGTHHGQNEERWERGRIVRSRRARSPTAAATRSSLWGVPGAAESGRSRPSELRLGFCAAEGDGEGEALTIGEFTARARHGGGLGASLKPKSGSFSPEWRGEMGSGRGDS